MERESNAAVDVTAGADIPGESPERRRAEVGDVDRSMYDFVKPESGYERFADGLSGDVVEEISRKKDEPDWMLQMRLKALETYERMEMPKNWGPAIGGLDMSTISTYVASGAKQAESWDDVPDDIKDTFERLGIPEAERTSLAGVGAQYDSEIVYHNMKDEVAKSGVVYTTVEDAMHSGYEDMIREHFGTLIPMTDHKFAALHYAVWSGGSFVYVPAGVKLDFPLQSYFRLNAAGAGQFEHTLIIVEPGADLHFIEGCSAPKYNVANLHAGAVELFVGKGARLRYSTIENWSKNMYNLNTKRVRVEEDGKVEWVSGSFGSHVSYLYPSSLLVGPRASCEFTGITFAGGGISTFRSSVVVTKKADRARASVSCSSLMLDDISRSDTIPAMDVRNATASVGHEATIGRISDDTILYLMSRGCSEQEARTMVVNGFADPGSKELPLEYAVEMNNLIKLEMEGAIG